MNTPHTHIFCDTCQAVREFKLADLPAQELIVEKFAAATDLLCKTCGDPVATLFLPIPRKALRLVPAA